MSFKDVYGHEREKKFFQQIINNKSLSHSYIFEGIQGIGKKHFAMNLVKAIYCKNQDIDACEVCDQCLKLNHGNHLDFLLIEPDGQSIKNEQIKDFQKFMSYKPNESIKKIVIIDNSHLMTTSAQNTMLKILEEPPAYGVIIFITENSKMLLETIQSRCQVIHFNPLDSKTMDDYLDESFDLNPEERIFIKTFSNGVISKAYQGVNHPDFLQMRQDIFEYTHKLLTGDVIFSLEKIDFLVKEKSNIEIILDIMSSWIRDILILQKTSNESMVQNKDQLEIMKKYSYRLVDVDLLKVIELIKETQQNIQWNVNYKLAIDNLVLRMIQLGGVI